MARETANLTATTRENDEKWLYEQTKQADFPANRSQLAREAIDKSYEYPEDGQ